MVDFSYSRKVVWKQAQLEAGDKLKEDLERTCREGGKDFEIPEGVYRLKDCIVIENTEVSSFSVSTIQLWTSAAPVRFTRLTCNSHAMRFTHFHSTWQEKNPLDRRREVQALKPRIAQGGEFSIYTVWSQSPPTSGETSFLQLMGCRTSPSLQGTLSW